MTASNPNASDIQIAQATPMWEIGRVAELAGIADEYVEPYGRYKAKISTNLLRDMADKPDGKLVLVTAMTPTPAGEGKTTVSVGLGDGLRRIGKKSVIALREPSLGPVFGVKGGAAGGGYAQVVPMEDINLHFTGDIHAVGAANNLLAAMVDNHVYQGNDLGFDLRRVTWKRCVDMNDRQLRNIVCGLGGVFKGVPREDGFTITVGTEVMAVLCLAQNVPDLKHRLGQVIVGYTNDNIPIMAHQLSAEGAMTALLKDAIKPNLVQTLEHTPAFIHGGPFANIAHGCNSLTATRMALKLGDYAVTEAGFGADLGAEKFIDIKCRMSGLQPDAAVLVASIRALKHHGGVDRADLGKPNTAAIERGLPNLVQHIENMQQVFGLNLAVALNIFPTDSAEEIAFVQQKCAELGVSAVPTEVWSKGGAGAEQLAAEVVRLCEQPSDFRFSYDLDMSVMEKLNAIASRIYRADRIKLSSRARKQLENINENGFDKMPICMAKTQYSFSDNKAQLGAPRNFSLHVRDIRVSAGAGFIVASTGDVLTMPGLPPRPAAELINVDEQGTISGLF